MNNKKTNSSQYEICRQDHSNSNQIIRKINDENYCITSNQRRHNYLIQPLHDVSTELFVIQESDTIFPGSRPRYPEEPEFEKYFEYVQEAEKKYSIFRI